VQARVVLKVSANSQLELVSLMQDSSYELQVLCKGVQTEATRETGIMLKGAQLVDGQQRVLSAQALSLWIDGTLLPMVPEIRQEIKARLNLWDYVEYDG